MNSRAMWWRRPQGSATDWVRPRFSRRQPKARAVMASAAAGDEAFELGHVFGVELVHGADAQQFHRPNDLALQDGDRTVDAIAATGHESIQVGTADERELGAHRDSRDDVGARHDAGVQMHLGVVADLAHDLGEQMERYGGAVELAASVVGQQDRVHTHRGKFLGIVDVLDALDDDLALPLLLDCLLYTSDA